MCLFHCFETLLWRTNNNDIITGSYFSCPCCKLKLYYVFGAFAGSVRQLLFGSLFETPTFSRFLDFKYKYLLYFPGHNCTFSFAILLYLTQAFLAEIFLWASSIKGNTQSEPGDGCSGLIPWHHATFMPSSLPNLSFVSFVSKVFRRWEVTWVANKI